MTPAATNTTTTTTTLPSAPGSCGSHPGGRCPWPPDPRPRRPARPGRAVAGSVHPGQGRLHPSRSGPPREPHMQRRSTSAGWGDQASLPPCWSVGAPTPASPRTTGAVGCSGWPGWSPPPAPRRSPRGGTARAPVPGGGGAVLAAGRLPDRQPARPDHNAVRACQGGHRGGEGPDPLAARETGHRLHAADEAGDDGPGWLDLAYVPASSRGAAPAGHAGRLG